MEIIPMMEICVVDSPTKLAKTDIVISKYGNYRVDGFN